MSKEIKAQTLDLAKVISYLGELQKTSNQNYITPEGIALLEGVVLAGNGKVKVVPEEELEDLQQRLMMQYDIIRGLKNKKKSWF